MSVNKIDIDEMGSNSIFRTYMGNAPFLQLDLRAVSSRLRCDELLQIANSVVLAALHADYVVGRNYCTTHEGDGGDVD